MRFAIDIAPTGDLADPRVVAGLARAAEVAGWDGLSVWDDLGVSMGGDFADPLVTLAAVAAATERLELIASVLVLPRRRPQLVAQSIATLDRLSGGRIVLGVGAGGDPPDFTAFGEDADPAVRASRLEEAVEVVDRLLRGEALDHHGAFYTVDGTEVGPRAVRRPRPPIWVGGMRPRGLRLAARWDGWIGIGADPTGELRMVLTPVDIRARVETVQAERARIGRAAHPFDVGLFACAVGLGPDDVAAYAEAGVSWWLESLSPMRGSVEELRAIVEAGPPGPREPAPAGA